MLPFVLASSVLTSHIHLHVTKVTHVPTHTCMAELNYGTCMHVSHSDLHAVVMPSQGGGRGGGGDDDLAFIT